MIFWLIGLEGLFVGAVSLSYKGHRYPVEVISHCVWLYHRFPLSFREVEELERGIVVSYETVRRWCVKLGQIYAGALRRRQPRPCPGGSARGCPGRCCPGRRLATGTSVLQ
jgi:putative transposase